MPLQLDLDLESFRNHMALRRAATEMRLPMDERLKVHFITRRAELLANFSITAGAWMLLLHGCQAQGEDRAALARLKDEVFEFKEWAEEGLQQLRLMGLQDALENDECEMPDDPELVAAFRRMLGVPAPKDPPDDTRG